jgi:hypothetical protein
MEKITVAFVFEILGRPPENVSSALEKMIEVIGKEKGVLIKKQKIHEPIEVKDAKDLFTAFAEIEVELDSLANYFSLIFAYPPSNIELITPQNITIQNVEFTELANAITRRIHTYDAIAKNYLIERDLLFKKLKEVSPEVYKQVTDYLLSEIEERKKDGKESES